MMALRYVNRFYSVCYLVLFLAISAVADYYYVNKEPQRSVAHIIVEDCWNAAARHHCFLKCGKNLACLLTQCFCLKVRAEAEEGQEGQEVMPKIKPGMTGIDETKNICMLSVLDEDVTEEKSSREEITKAKDFDEDEEEEQELPYNYETENVDEEIVDQRPALRHHIAHFCPNLDKARSCIRKCMKLGVPAFCGKDHVCYCRHNYQDSRGEPKVDPGMVHNQFKDLYEKYFGPKYHKSNRAHRTHKYRTF